jgi:hypothetical protein
MNIYLLSSMCEARLYGNWEIELITKPWKWDQGQVTHVWLDINRCNKYGKPRLYDNGDIDINNMTLLMLSLPENQYLCRVSNLILKLFSVLMFYGNDKVKENSPPIPPKPRTNWAPSCDLSVIISNVAPVIKHHYTS